SDPEQLLDLARTGHSAAVGQLLEMYRHYLTLLARLQISRRLQGKADASDVVQETFLRAHRDFANLRGITEEELAASVGQVLAASLVDLMRRYYGTRRRDVLLEQELVSDLDQSSRCLDRGLVAKLSSPSSPGTGRAPRRGLGEASRRLSRS